jgi:NADPH:quinone reductase-like Zn-dependent oxidoreductase
MKAFRLTDTTGIADLRAIDIPVPGVASDEVLVRVRVRAISPGPDDVRAAHNPGPYSPLKNARHVGPGLSISGEAVALGADVQDFMPGDAVFDVVSFPGHGRTYTEYEAVPARHLAHKPANTSHAEAAATALAALTAWQALMATAKVQPGQRVLIQGAGGGVGHFAVQLAKERGAFVIGTSSAGKRVFVLSLGADVHVDYTRQRFEDVVPPVDVVLDAVGGETARRSLAVLKPDGLLISRPAGPDLWAQARAGGVRAQHFSTVSSAKDLRQLAERLAAGTLHAHVSRTWPFAQLPQALFQVAGGHTQGKVSVLLD